MIAKWVAVLLLASPSGLAAAQQQTTQAKPQQDQKQQSQAREQAQQQDPLAAAARLTREQQKNQPHAAKVWDNDNLPTTPGSVSVVGKPAAAAETAAGPPSQGVPAATQAEGEKNAASIEKRKAELQEQLDEAKAHLKSVKTDLDIATRTYQLDQQMFYSNPNYASDTQGAAKLKAEQSDIAAKKQEVDDLQKNIDGLTAKLQELEK
jgi:hypothetical protein